MWQLTRLLKHITGQKEQPSVQQQQIHPQKSHFTLLAKKKKEDEMILIQFADMKQDIQQKHADI